MIFSLLFEVVGFIEVLSDSNLGGRLIAAAVIVCSRIIGVRGIEGVSCLI